MPDDIRPPQRSKTNSPPPQPPEAISIDETGRPEGHVAAVKPAKTHPLLAWWQGLNRNVRFGLVALGLLLFMVAAIGIYKFTKPSGNPSLEVIKHQKAAVPTTVPSPLTGLAVDPQAAGRPVTGVMIENSTDARPQSGLQDAGVVYEAIAEAGITRFLALFQDATPQYIGPVRSLRPYFLDYATAYQASIAHVGGSPDALAQVRNGQYRDLDEFFNSGAFFRISSRYAPHNVYTTFNNLDKLNQAKGYTKSSYTPWERKKDARLKTPTAVTIDFSVSSAAYYAHYDYNAINNRYSRSEGGAPHKDLVSAADKTGVQLAPKVVIAIVVPQSFGALDASGAYYTDYADTGSGTAYIFQDGGVTVGSWHKADQVSMLTFTDANGATVKLDAGQTWITLVGSPDKVKYSAPPPPAKTP